MRISSLMLLLLLACGDPPTERPVKEGPALVTGEPELDDHEPRLPGDGGALGPSLARFGGDTAALATAATCATCHEDVAETWAGSAHARSSFDNPWYRASIDAFREERGPEASRFCGGCHDPALLSVGAMDDPVEPTDARAHAGITCLVCHSTTQTTGDGNGSVTVAITDPLLPDPGNDAQIEAHRRRMRPDPLGEARLCGSCHRSFAGSDIGSPHHVNGIEDIGAWRASPYAGSHARRIDDPVDEATCSGCHMPLVAAPLGDMASDDGRVRSHAVRGAHTALGDHPDTQAMLRGAATIDVAQVQVDGRWRAPEQAAAEGALEGEVLVDVVVRNTGVGHRFPGGTRDLQDTWVELVVRDGRGAIVAEAGTDHEHRDDPSAFVFRATVLDDEGRPERLHRVDRFRTPGFDRTIAPRDASVIRYAATLERATGPFTFEAHLRHRRHARAFQRFACDASRSARGRAFDRTTLELGRAVIDPCREEPVLDIATSRVTPTTSPADAFLRQHDLALALAHSVQERLDEARPVLEAAREVAETPRRRAMVDLIGARVAARQGRLDEALTLASAASQNAPDALAAIARVRGEAYAQVWQWAEAAEAFAVVAERAPGDVASWRDLARARGSAGDDRGALDAARRGLALGPRDAALLRSQHLALERLDLASEAARDAFLRYRALDEGPSLLRACQRDVEGCDRDRQPVPRVQMRVR